MTEVLKETDFKNLGKKKTGKVRDIYDLGDPSTGSGQAILILVTTDRHSSFDRIIAHIPSKGQVLNQISAWWFEQTKDIIPNQVLAVPDPNVTVAKKYNMVPVEAVMRGYLTGVTDTSIWTRYQKGVRDFGGITLPDGMKKNTKLPRPIFDPTTKEDAHDRAITPEQMIEEGLITKELLEEVRSTATKLFLRGQEVAAKKGLILVDTKYEFGTDPSTSLGAGDPGELVLID
ncbi:MAG: phosphoribosylaminoimidazolesuccinocarboxamide synthase, partial [Patescibacteria group bacterium]